MRHSHRPFLPVLVTAILLIHAPAWGAEALGKSAELRFTQRTNSWVVVSRARSVTKLEGEDFKTVPALALRPGETIRIVIEDPNRFFFAYAFDEVERVPTANFQAAQTFGEALAKFLAIPGVAATAEAIRFGRALAGSDATNAFDALNCSAGRHVYSEQVAQLMEQRSDEVKALFSKAGLVEDGQAAFLAEYLSLIELLDRRHDCTDSLIKSTVDAAKAAEAKAIVASWDDLEELETELRVKAEVIDTVRRKLTVEVLPAARVASEAALATAEAVLQARQAMVAATEASAAADRGAEEARKKSKRMASAATASALDRALAEAAAAQEDARIAAVNYQDARQLEATATATASARETEAVLLALVTDPLYVALQLMPDAQTQGESMLTALVAFREAMEELDEPRELGTVAYDSDNVITAKVTITANKERKAAAEALKRPLGQFTLEFEPYSTVQLAVGGVLIYSFTKTSGFDVEASADKFKIVERDAEQFKGTQVAAMLSIVPTRWAESDFHPAFQIGVNPEKNLGLYAGIGVHFTKIFSFGVGAAFEQVERLTKGLSPGDILDSRDKFKTEKRFKGGWYLHLSASVPLGKKKD
jgi:hypothetical protein